MSSLIKLDDLSIQLGKSSGFLYTIVSNYRKEYKKEPDWFVIKSAKDAYVDLDKFNDHMTLVEELNIYLSNKLYWIFKATNHADFDIARILAKRSKYFTSEMSWNMFLKHNLFIAQDSKVQLITKPTMTTEFLRIGTKYIYLLKKWKGLDLSVADEYF